MPPLCLEAVLHQPVDHEHDSAEAEARVHGCAIGTPGGMAESRVQRCDCAAEGEDRDLGRDLGFEEGNGGEDEDENGREMGDGGSR